MRAKFLPDTLTLSILSAVILANLLPCQGQAAVAFSWAANGAISLLFFMHGAKLPRATLIAGAMHWRLHLLIFGCTFAVFPLLGLTLKPILSLLVTPILYTGILFLCILPSTIQASITFTAVAKGNVAAAICSAPASNLLGILITPLFASLIFSQHGVDHALWLSAVKQIAFLLLVPFIIGQMTRRWLAASFERHARPLKWLEQCVIPLVAYTAFSEAVVQGLWSQVAPRSLLGLIIVNGVLLMLGLIVTGYLSKLAGFSQADRITILFCGSQRSLGSGVAIAQIVFAGYTVGVAILPLMLFHPMQLIVGSLLAQYYRARATPYKLASLSSRD
ncbi:Putative Na+-dependent transporter [Mycoavidus cysteinexigens]|uniref:Na+-dependent transporter n=1 Tax=Mycoavidus cysteinexigens TaxID=1553431 RepID=A0A2Z6ES29_9BURK|nr:bile acid:sodium symporter family protein [Mycoavidus cysteinexigens]BBE08207.1 Putative Na+-dependent transporter [Mycoavidus cysteinexigens]GAM53087.1 sodium/bile acid symporter family [bacterium endosymbiont of Mortierella elongata FMR23-6]GLR02001.1 hypothetical protein GCM10007934_18140 [Mycoavidus cysteinexigens]